VSTRVPIRDTYEISRDESSGNTIVMGCVDLPPMKDFDTVSITVPVISRATNEYVMDDVGEMVPAEAGILAM
jgi:hypothetical protein